MSAGVPPLDGGADGAGAGLGIIGSAKMISSVSGLPGSVGGISADMRRPQTRTHREAASWFSPSKRRNSRSPQLPRP